MADYLPLLTLLVLAILFCLVSALVSRLVAPKRPTSAKLAPYECGIVPARDVPERFPVRFYLVAMIFIIFDIEIIFLYPYAVLNRQLGSFGLAEMALFGVAVFVSFTYLIANGALDWGPLKSTKPVVDEQLVAAARSARTTVRRVGTEGRSVDDQPVEGQPDEAA